MQLLGSRPQADGTIGLVANVTTVQQTREMFNLTVSEAHTYYVGNDGWLVHNADKTYITYVFKNAVGEVVYVGRASGSGTPEQILKGRLGKGHHVFDSNTGLTSEVKAVQNSAAANKGAEQVWYEYYSKQGNALLNDPSTPPISSKPSKQAAAQAKIQAYADDLNTICP